MPGFAHSLSAFPRGLTEDEAPKRWRAGLLTAAAHLILIGLVLDIYSARAYAPPAALSLVLLKDPKPALIPLASAPKLARIHRIIVPPPEVEIAPQDGNGLVMVGGPVAYALGDAAYRAQIEAHLARFKPTVHGEGVVYVQMIWDEQGHVLFVHIGRSSGSPALDQAALDMVQKADPLPPIPANINAERLYLMLPIKFP